MSLTSSPVNELSDNGLAQDTPSAGPSTPGTQAPSTGLSRMSPQNVLSKCMARIRSSFSRQAPHTPSAQDRAAESARRAQIKRRVAKAAQSKAAPTFNAIVQGLKFVLSKLVPLKILTAPEECPESSVPSSPERPNGPSAPSSSESSGPDNGCTPEDPATSNDLNIMSIISQLPLHQYPEWIQRDAAVISSWPTSRAYLEQIAMRIRLQHYDEWKAVLGPHCAFQLLCSLELNRQKEGAAENERLRKRKEEEAEKERERRRMEKEAEKERERKRIEEEAEKERERKRMEKEAAEKERKRKRKRKQRKQDREERRELLRSGELAAERELFRLCDEMRERNKTREKHLMDALGLTALESPKNRCRKGRIFKSRSVAPRYHPYATRARRIANGPFFDPSKQYNGASFNSSVFQEYDNSKEILIGRYENLWATLMEPSAPLKFTYRSVPWPMKVIPETPEYSYDDIWDFIHTVHYSEFGCSLERSRQIIQHELNRWSSPNVFDRILPRILDPDEREMTRIGALTLRMGLNDMINWVEAEARGTS